MWPTDNTTLSLFCQLGLSGSIVKNSEYKIYVKSASDIGPPGWPELALLTPSITSPLITLTVNKSLSSFAQLLKSDNFSKFICYTFD